MYALDLELFVPSAVDSKVATKIAEEYLSRLNKASELTVVLAKEKTIEREFGWVFFYGPDDRSILVAGNAAFIVDRKDGSIHVTGTAFPVEQYLESYARVGRAYPFAVPEDVVVIEECKPGISRVSLTELIQSATGNGLAEAKQCADEVLGGKAVTLTFPTATEADEFCEGAKQLSVLTRRETRFR